MATAVIKSNASQATDVTIADLGIIIPSSGGTETLDEFQEILEAQKSEDLRAYLVDNAHGASSSTLIMNDGSSDIAQADAVAFLTSVLLEFGGANAFGVVTTNSSGEIPDNLTFVDGQTFSNFELGNDMDAGGFKITNAAVAVAASDVPTLAQVQALAASNKIYKELLLHSIQLDSTNDAISQAVAFFLDGQVTSGDTLVVSDGTTTRTYGFGAGGDVTVTIGADADETMDNLATSISGDVSGLWDAVVALNLQDINDGSGTSSAGRVVIIYRANQSADSFDDRIYSSGANTTPANFQYVNFNGETDYEISTNTQLPSADPTQKEFGLGRSTASLVTNETHLERNTDTEYTWNSDDGQWVVTGVQGLVAGAGLTKSGDTINVGAGNGILVNADDIEIDFGEVGDIASLGTSASAGVLNEAARADHVHTHGDRGADGAVSQHDAQQIDVTGSYTNIGSPTDVETALSNINDEFGSGVKAGKWLTYNLSQSVAAGGTTFMNVGNVQTSAAAPDMLRAGTIVGASIQVDVADAANSYNVSIRVNGTQQGTLALASTNDDARTVGLSIAYAAGDDISIALVRTAGSGKSDFKNVVVILEFLDT